MYVNLYPEPKALNIDRITIEEWIEQFILINNFSYPIDLMKLVEKLGGKLDYLNEYDKINLDGSIVVEKFQDFTISLPKNTGFVRDRFTIGHELGHYFLHSNMGEKKIQATRNGTTQVEVEANWFSASLLMPESKVKEMLSKTKNIYELADYFNVSVQAMSIRLKHLSKFQTL